VTTQETVLEASEISALIDLIRVTADLDGDITPDESDEIALIAKQVGDEPFWAQVQASAFKAARDIKIEECASMVTRREAQELIFSLLEGLAQSDGVDASERAALDELRHLWAIED